MGGASGGSWGPLRALVGAFLANKLAKEAPSGALVGGSYEAPNAGP